MPSLRQLLAAHAPLLLIDAASAAVQVGWLESPDSATWTTSPEEAGVGVFRALAELARAPADAGAFVFCDGPGSILGIRTVAMALRSWCVLSPRPVFAYHSLTLVAQALERPEVRVISDARRERWHCATPDGALRRVITAELDGEIVMPDGFRSWAPVPAAVTRVPYALAALLPRVADRDLFRPVETPDAFLHEEPSYVTWTPQIHRAP